VILAFELSMPGVGSWNGLWSGEIFPYVKVVTWPNTKKRRELADKILAEAYYRYDFGDGWAAGVSVREVDAVEARKLRKASSGFAGYDWMVDEIIREGVIVPLDVRLEREKERQQALALAREASTL